MIYDPEPSFDFSSLTLISPTTLSGGNYFIRCLAPKQSSFYIQPPRCILRQGISKAGSKKLYCDLIFKHEDESFVEFIGLLETYLQSQIFENREKWFESALELDEIENCFTPSLKIIKSGKMYNLRVTLPSGLGKCTLRIFNENEETVLPENILENSNVMTVIEIKGVKCSSKSFQLELEMKQMMILQPVDLFDSCVFKKNTKKIEVEKPKVTVLETTILVKDIEKKDSLLENEILENDDEEKDLLLEQEVLEQEVLEKEVLEKEKEKEKEVPIPKTRENQMELVDIELPLEEETFQIKKRNEVYFEMYAEAKKKAKMAHDFAISAYLEAKRIKNTYLLNEDAIETNEMENEEKELTEMFF